MKTIFTRERFGRPQFLAALLLLVFLAQSSWLVYRQTKDPKNGSDPLDLVVQTTVAEASGGMPTGMISAHIEPMNGTSPSSSSAPSIGSFVFRNNPNHSPLWYLIVLLPARLWPGSLTVPAAQWLLSLPSLCFAVLLGASLWYVARRLYGNAGGYIALSLYCFSPTILRSASLWRTPPEIGAAWGAFGAIFTAIAVAHTLYAPREVVLWNWRRILLLGVSFTLAIGSQFSLLLLVPAALAFMLYLAPARRMAALVIWASACGIAVLLLFAAFYFHFSIFYSGLHHADFFPVLWPAFKMKGAYAQSLLHLLDAGPAFVLMLPLAVIVYALWRRARYFGNAAPLLVGLFLFILVIATPHYPGFGFTLIALPFLFVFVSGVAADLLETPARPIVLPLICAFIASGALWNFWQLLRIQA